MTSPAASAGGRRRTAPGRRREAGGTGGRAGRRRVAREVRRGAILDAARAVIRRRGIAEATVRAIAAEAGCAAAALYAYYPGKEAILGDLLARELGEMQRTIRERLAGTTGRGARVRAAVETFFESARARADILDAAGCLLAEGGVGTAAGRRPAGLPPAVDRRVNGRLITLLALLAEVLEDDGGLSPVAARRETVALAAHLAGVLALARTGRLAVLDASAESLAGDYLAALLDRCPATAGERRRAAPREGVSRHSGRS